MNIARFTIAELPIPSTLSAPEAAGFIDMVRVRNAVESAAYGMDAFSCTPQELLPHYQLPEYEPKRVFTARVGARTVGRAVYEWPIEEGDTATWAVVEVLPDFRRRGIGTALLELVERLHAESGRTTIQGYVAHARVDGGKRLVPPTGAGSIPADDPGARFLLARGYTLEQVARGSSIRLPLDPADLAARRAVAKAAAGENYRVLSWTGSTHERWTDDFAVMHTTMSTADPSAGLDVTEEVWDADRVRSYESTLLGSGRALLTSVVEHVASARLAGFTRLSVPADRSRPTSQEETLVLEAHRGHRLGMLLKTANLEHLASVAPETPLVYTFNAEENRHMLSVNEAVGFVPIGHEGAWKKVTRQA